MTPTHESENRVRRPRRPNPPAKSGSASPTNSPPESPPISPSELLSASLDGELDSVGEAQLARRLASDPALRAERERHLQVRAALFAASQRVAPDPAFVARHRARREALSPVARWTWRQFGTRLAAAAAFLVAAAVTTLWLSATGALEATPPGGLPAPFATLEGLEGEALGAPADVPFAFSGFAGPGGADGLAATEDPVLLIALGDQDGR